MFHIDTEMQPKVDSNKTQDFVEILVPGKGEDEKSVVSKQKLEGCFPLRPLSMITTSIVKVIGIGDDRRRVVHAAKVGLALVLVSLVYMIEPVHDRMGDNAMWAVITVVVIFEFTAGATISKGINRGIGTILGGGLGSLVAILAQEIGGAGKAVAIGTSVFIFCSTATYIRMLPSVKKRHDYGAMVFILTFSLVAVSGVRGDQIVKIASDRLFSIFIGFAICVVISVYMFPVWNGDNLHNSLTKKFDHLASSIEECVDDSMNKPLDDKLGTQTVCSHKKCLSVLSSKTTDETMANFAKWEPKHGRFGFEHPWNQYLKIGDVLREIAASILAMTVCLQSETQLSSQCTEEGNEQRYETTCSLLACTLRELGREIHNMKRYQQVEPIISELRTVRSELCMPDRTVRSELCMPDRSSKLDQSGPVCGHAPSSLFLLGEIVDKVEQLVEEVEILAITAGFTDV